MNEATEQFLTTLQRRYDDLSDRLVRLLDDTEQYKHARAKFVQDEIRAIESAMIKALAALAPNARAVIGELSAKKAPDHQS